MPDTTARAEFCRNCGLELTELLPPPQIGLQPDRVPCPNCGSTAREYRITLSAVQGISATFTDSVSVQKAVATGTFTRTVVWSKTPDAWLAEIHDADGNRVAVEVAFSTDDLFLLLDDHIIPPEA